MSLRPVEASPAVEARSGAALPSDVVSRNAIKEDDICANGGRTTPTVRSDGAIGRDRLLPKRQFPNLFTHGTADVASPHNHTPRFRSPRSTAPALIADVMNNCTGVGAACGHGEERCHHEERLAKSVLREQDLIEANASLLAAETERAAVLQNMAGEVEALTAKTVMLQQRSDAAVESERKHRAWNLVATTLSQRTDAAVKARDVLAHTVKQLTDELHTTMSALVNGGYDDLEHIVRVRRRVEAERGGNLEDCGTSNLLVQCLPRAMRASESASSIDATYHNFAAVQCCSGASYIPALLTTTIDASAVGAAATPASPMVTAVVDDFKAILREVASVPVPEAM
jgi:hypothetical protein